MPPADAPAPRSLIMLVASHKELEAVIAGLGGPARTDDAAANARAGVRYATRVGIDVVLTGVGKAPAAAIAAMVLDEPALVINIGIAGVLPGHEALAPAPDATALAERVPIVVATRCVLADEGVETPAGFDVLASLGFGLDRLGLDPRAIEPQGVRVEPGLVRALQRALEHTTKAGVHPAAIATVSTCSGTDARAQAIAGRTQALAEAMEGAAVGLAAAARSCPFAEVRIISNTTGQRDRQRWWIASALRALGNAAQHIAAAERQLLEAARVASDHR